MVLIDGRAIAKRIISRLKQKKKSERGLTAIIAGDDPASLSFLRQKERVAQGLNIPFELHRLPKSSRTASLPSRL